MIHGRSGLSAIFSLHLPMFGYILPLRCMANARRERAVRLERLTYSVDEAAVLLGISRGKAYECIRSGKLKATRLGRRFVVSAHALEGLLGQGEAPTSSADVLNQVEVVGHLTRAPEVRATRTGNRMELCAWPFTDPTRNAACTSTLWPSANWSTTCWG